MKYFLIAGEASGDLHASRLIKALRDLDSEAQFRFMGGDLMKNAAGVEPEVHYKDMAYMGLFEVLANLKTIRKNFRKIEQAVLDFRPDAVIPVDYPGFNLRISKRLKNKGFRIFYYISPKLWAWKENRVEIIRKYVDELYLILPFEVEFYRKHGINAEYVGNPVKEAVEDFMRQNSENDFSVFDKPLIALLPGSRKQEIRRMLPVMAALPELFPAYDFIIAGAPSVSLDFYKEILGETHIPVLFGKTYDILKNARAAVVTSGTATLETALFGVPQVVGYKTGSLQYHLGKRLVKIPYFSLVNLILNREAVPELLQNQFNIHNIQKHLKAILQGDAREKMLNDYRELNQIIGQKTASREVARRILQNIK